jgi:predicted kinase
VIGASYLRRPAGVGKTTIAQEPARQIGAMHVRIESIEQAIRDCTPVVAPLQSRGVPKMQRNSSAKVSQAPGF